MQKIMLIEDDISIFNLLKEKFLLWSFEVIGPNDFQQVLPTFIEQKPQLVIIDIQLPAYDGFHWCREIRVHSKVPIIFLSSRDHPMDMIMAMQMGADDFVQKPFNMEVLLAKVQALLRRTYDYTEEQSDIVQWNGAIIDYSRSNISKGDKEVELTKNELFILKILYQFVDKIVSRDDLMRKLWDDEKFVNDNTLSVNVNRLRFKLEQIGLEEVIITKKGLGYMAVTKGEL
ncbi:response regulator transcription factor [Psychrobacillus psychrodurans]|uniref:response regulator transcription factor n=1 Tax=Psychrobacillus psychrodurans TaxID=126157 RepID=UPI001F4E0041|nr:response regulator transcription factor [Psychrobacillus psychrodurans]MCK1997741.1 response regulator transcription factor [Psychrobacillus psychrodurans]